MARKPEAKATEHTEETQSAAEGAVVPDGYAARTIVLPAQHWKRIDRFAEMAKLTHSEWLERYLRFVAK